jgi:signal transduction histidine kinase
MSAPVAEVRSAEKLHLLTEVSQRIASILNVDELMVEVVRLIQKTFGYYHVGIGLIEGENVVYRVGAGELWDSTDFQFKPARLKVGREGVTGWVAATGNSMLIPDVSQEPRYIWMQGSQTRSELTVPISIKGQVIGVLDMQSDHLHAFDATDLELMLALANQTGVAIENARLFAAERRRAGQFRVLTEVNQQIASILEIDELLQHMVRLVQSTFGYYHLEIGLVEGDELFFKVGAGELWERTGHRTEPARLKIGAQGITGWVAANGKPLVTPDVSREPRYIPLKGSRARSELTVPIITKGQVIGVLDVESDRLNAFDETDLELMTSLANQAGIALENARLYKNARAVAALEERQRLARELHDSVTQSLYGITLYSQAAAGQMALKHFGRVEKHLDEINETSQEALAEMRLLIYQLRPPVLEKEGILTALQARLSAVEGRAGLKTSLKADLTTRLPLAVEEGLYHIAQEALNNTLKHAHAQCVSVTLHQEEALVTLEVSDDGSGFEVASTDQRGKMGLADMEDHARELGGRLSILSQPGQGTRIRVEVRR